VQCIGRTSTISEEDDFPAASQRRRTFFGKLADTSDELVGEGLLYSSAFLELPSDFVGV
jgi:hypothetical protein